MRSVKNALWLENGKTPKRANIVVSALAVTAKGSRAALDVA